MNETIKETRKLKRNILIAAVIVIGIITILGSRLAIHIRQNMADRVEQVATGYNVEQMEYARDTGYKQSCVELAYYLGMISDNDYQKYLDMSEKYTKNPNARNLKDLSELVNQLIKDLPMWDDLINNII